MPSEEPYNSAKCIFPYFSCILFQISGLRPGPKADLILWDLSNSVSGVFATNLIISPIYENVVASNFAASLINDEAEKVG